MGARKSRRGDSRWASRHKWLTKTRNEPQGGARVRKDGLLWFQARSAQLERATKLAARIGWELSVFSSLFSTGRDWRSSIARKLRREKDCRCLGVRGLTSWLPTKHTWDCSYFLRRAHRLFPRLSPATSAPSIMSSGNNTQFKSLEEWARALSAPSQALPPFPGRWLLAVRLARFVFSRPAVGGAPSGAFGGESPRSRSARFSSSLLAPGGVSGGVEVNGGSTSNAPAFGMGLMSGSTTLPLPPIETPLLSSIKALQIELPPGGWPSHQLQAH